jgi:hypothetical protein
MNTSTLIWTDLQTMRIAYQEIARGERPWNALGDFMNYWFGYTPDQRLELVCDPLDLAANATPEATRWAVFCAASVEYLCERYDIPCPAWVNDPAYTALSEPWFKGLGASKPAVQERLRRETPEPFCRRNIYCGDRMFDNKYEMAAQRRSA